jgi:pyruvate kinase
MLSQESAVGRYPVEAVKTMAEIIKNTEESPYDDLILKNYKGKIIPIDTAIAFAASTLARDVQASAILVATISGYTARMVSRHRPELPIIVTAESEKVRRQLALSWGVIPYVLPKCKTVDELINKAVLLAYKKKIVKKGDKIIIIGGQPVGKSGNANLIKIHKV